MSDNTYHYPTTAGCFPVRSDFQYLRVGSGPTESPISTNVQHSTAWESHGTDIMETIHWQRIRHIKMRVIPIVALNTVQHSY